VKSFRLVLNKKHLADELQNTSSSEQGTNFAMKYY